MGGQRAVTTGGALDSTVWILELPVADIPSPSGSGALLIS